MQHNFFKCTEVGYYKGRHLQVWASYTMSAYDNCIFIVTCLKLISGFQQNLCRKHTHLPPQNIRLFKEVFDKTLD